MPCLQPNNVAIHGPSRGPVPSPCHSQGNPRFQFPRSWAPLQWLGREDNRTVNGTFEPRHWHLARGCKLLLHSQTLHKSDTLHWTNLPMQKSPSYHREELCEAWVHFSHNTSRAKWHVSATWAVETSSTIASIHRPTRQWKKSSNSGHHALWFSSEKLDEKELGGHIRFSKRYLHSRLAVAGSKMARDQRRRVPDWSEWQCHQWRCLKSNLSIQHRRRCKSAPKHRPDSSLKESSCEEQRCSELLPRTKNQCQDRSGMTGGTDHATMCPRPRLSQEPNESEKWDACNLACDPRKLYRTENCDKLPSSGLLSTSVHPPSQEPWHDLQENTRLDKLWVT